MGNLVYHGSRNYFNEFVIDPNYSAYADPARLDEGYGIYMTEDFKVASDYGQYLYTINLDNSFVTDFTSGIVVRDTILKLEQMLGINFKLYFNVNEAIEYLMAGRLNIVNLDNDIYNYLDASYKFYEHHGNYVESFEDNFRDHMKTCYRSLVGNVFKYKISTFKEPLYICFRNPETLIIENITYTGEE